MDAARLLPDDESHAPRRFRHRYRLFRAGMRRLMGTLRRGVQPCATADAALSSRGDTRRGWWTRTSTTPSASNTSQTIRSPRVSASVLRSGLGAATRAGSNPSIADMWGPGPATSHRDGYLPAFVGDEVGDRCDLLRRVGVLERRHRAHAVRDALDHELLRRLRLVEVRADVAGRIRRGERVAAAAAGLGEDRLAVRCAAARSLAAAPSVARLLRERGARPPKRRRRRPTPRRRR